MERIRTAVVALLLISLFCPAREAFAEQVSIEEAVRRATGTGNAGLNAMAAELRSAEAAALQAGRRTNPALALEVENVGSEDAGTETTLSVGQRVEIGGDRRARIDTAAAAREIVRLDNEARLLESEARVRSAYAALLAAQQHASIAVENVASAEAAFGAIRDRVSAGKVSPIEETRAAVTLATEQIQRTRAEAELASARLNLASTWGGSAEGLVAEPHASLAATAGDVERNLELRRAAIVVMQREAEARLARAHAVPDLQASAGLRTYEHGGGPAAVAGVAIELPMFDRNRDAVAAANARVEAARFDAAAVRVRLTSELGAARLRQDTARQTVERYRAEIIPAAESVYEAMTEGYRLGKFGYLEVLDARRTLAEARLQLVATERELAFALVDVTRLGGGWK